MIGRGPDCVVNYSGSVRSRSKFVASGCGCGCGCGCGGGSLRGDGRVHGGDVVERHEAGEHGHDHLGLALRDVLGQGVHSRSHTSRHRDRVLRVRVALLQKIQTLRKKITENTLSEKPILRNWEVLIYVE